MNTISPKELELKLAQNQDLILLDVREDWEYEELNIGGRLFPLNSLPFKLQELEGFKTREIVLHCKSGARSTQARKYLEKQGFKNLKTLTGGLEAFLRYKEQ